MIRIGYLEAEKALDHLVQRFDLNDGTVVEALKFPVAGPRALRKTGQQP
ncbi:MAG: hypothetical protein M0R06_07265 [Sphaerochaeta sp.]|jgi:hypothetical protein|nr:hypothetical protein [Sphaerochaeta sp.]MCK9598818.1 hypothetical protein [Sphaerochaeta sp.]MDX9824656.1 hypothetical protein [Sphaerochaeta sp.]